MKFGYTQDLEIFSGGVQNMYIVISLNLDFNLWRSVKNKTEKDLLKLIVIRYYDIKLKAID
jgi:hypothetical protein